MSDDKRKRKKKSTAAPLTYKKSILVSKKSFHQLLTGKKKNLADDDDETGDTRQKQTKKKIMWGNDGDGLPQKGEVYLLPQSHHNHTSSSSSDMGEMSQRKQRSNNKSISELMSMLPARPDRATHHFVAWLSTMRADRIDWDENTFQVIIDGVCKNNSNLADILTFLEDEEPIGHKMFASSHTTGDFLGILMGTTHFIDVVS